MWLGTGCNLLQVQHLQLLASGLGMFRHAKIQLQFGLDP